MWSNFVRNSWSGQHALAIDTYSFLTSMFEIVTWNCLKNVIKSLGLLHLSSSKHAHKSCSHVAEYSYLISNLWLLEFLLSHHMNYTSDVFTWYTCSKLSSIAHMHRTIYRQWAIITIIFYILQILTIHTTCLLLPDLSDMSDRNSTSCFADAVSTPQESSPWSFSDVHTESWWHILYLQVFGLSLERVVRWSHLFWAEWSSSWRSLPIAHFLKPLTVPPKI